MTVNGRDKDKKISKRRLIRNGTVAAVIGSLYVDLQKRPCDNPSIWSLY